MAKAKQAIPAGHHTVTPVLTLDDAAQAIKWYQKAFGAKEIGRSTAPDGKILHAEIEIGDSRVMLNDPIMGSKSPKSLSGSPASLWIYVEDCDGFFERALSAGAHVYGGTRWQDVGSVLGRPNGHPDRSLRLPMVDRDEKGRPVPAGERSEDRKNG